MSTKQILIVAVILLLAGGATYFVISNNRQAPKTTPIAVTPTPTPSPVALSTWVSDAGFSFQYPQGSKVDEHPEDNKNYANLTITFPSQEVVSVIMADNTFKNLDAWVGKNSAFDTTLDGRPAKKILENDKETIACIDNDVIVTISGSNISGIAKSWTFIYPTPTVATTKKVKTVAPTEENVLEEE